MSQQKKRYKFDWLSLNPETWRGPCKSFPISVELVIVPEFNELVIYATRTFPELELVPQENVQIRVLNEWDRGEDGEVPFNEMGPSDLGLRLHYFEGEHRDYVLKLSKGDEDNDLFFNA